MPVINTIKVTDNHINDHENNYKNLLKIERLVEII